MGFTILRSSEDHHSYRTINLVRVYLFGCIRLCFCLSTDLLFSEGDLTQQAWRLADIDLGGGCWAPYIRSDALSCSLVLG